MQGVTDYGKDPGTGYHTSTFFKTNRLANYIGKAQLMEKPLGVLILQFTNRDDDISRAVKSVADTISFDERAHDPAKARYYFIQLEADEQACSTIKTHMHERLAGLGMNEHFIAAKSFVAAKDSATPTPQSVLDDLEALIKQQMQH